MWWTQSAEADEGRRDQGEHQRRVAEHAPPRERAMMVETKPVAGMKMM